MSNTEPNSAVPLRRVVLTAITLLILPVATHVGVVYHEPLIALGGIAVFLLPVVLANMRGGRYLPLVVAVATIALLGWLFGAFSLLYAVPVAINVSLCALFGSTLLPGNTPLITAYVELQYDSVTPEMRRYTRRVTVVWSGFFAIIALQSLLLALFAPAQVWSLFTNCLNYLFVLALFAVEYRIRRRVLRNRRHPGFMRFLANLLRTDFRRLRKQST